MEYWGITDTGKVRTQNQDAWKVEELDRHTILAVVCDGMGGAKAGNIASKLATAKVSAWKYIIILALIMLVLGIFITFNKGAVAALIGWFMIATGIVGIISDAMFISNVNKVTENLTKK